ncbi:DUF1929-domain-containing protein [Rozella allomycis CSF55]|uniref:DUF1929-domain-containing protein n=1 Tax=Rozella allomycis (strain CSF55) TaxID=988480 RepID=A0A075AVK5_ROZAC|nr:DUF1929 domain-containing protein [Rozella allomycis CSF55]RKP20295.1 DUF1929-domain-containing protein [Rozella allomycis CSF55]|eukprot:EPZ32737.1 DUF1929 domain-containing protein [Rozella allomycis CSF55]
MTSIELQSHNSSLNNLANSRRDLVNVQDAKYDKNRKWKIAGGVTSGIILVGLAVGLGVYYGIKSSQAGLDPPLEPLEFIYKDGLDYPWNTYWNETVSTKQDCASLCQLKYTDKSSRHFTQFRDQIRVLFGEVRFGYSLGNTTEASPQACLDKCKSSNECDLVAYKEYLEEFEPDMTGKIYCMKLGVPRDSDTTIGFAKNPYGLNLQPKTKGRFDVIGNSGVVAIHANLMPNGKILYSARPEVRRKDPKTGQPAPNTKAVSRPSIAPFGEIATVFDPLTGTFVTAPVDENTFCNGALLAADGSVFYSGGDPGGDISRAPGYDLQDGLKKQRYFNYKTGQWTYIHDMVYPRWYPSPIRLVDGTIFSFGGSTNGADGIPQPNMDITKPGVNVNTAVPSPLILETGTANYPYVHLIPFTGHVFVFAYQHWAIVDKNTGLEIERQVQLTEGIRGGDYVTGATLLPLEPEKNYEAEFVIFGGANNRQEEKGLRTVAHLLLTTTGPKNWFYDSDLMPYGRTLTMAVNQPNGKILIFGGGHAGKTGADPNGLTFIKGPTNDVFCYDPYAPAGKKFTVFATTPINRLYHSTAILLPDGRTTLSGGDEATFITAQTYEYRVEAFTPPWLLNDIPRPEIKQAPTGLIAYGSTFTVTYSGTVSRVSIVTPGSSTHAVDFTQRVVFLKVEQKDSSSLTLRAPPDATIILQGYHMLFLLNNDTPSVAAWVQFG